jgi:hypothetical protein
MWLKLCSFSKVSYTSAIGWQWQSDLLRLDLWNNLIPPRNPTEIPDDSSFPHTQQLPTNKTTLEHYTQSQIIHMYTQNKQNEFMKLKLSICQQRNSCRYPTAKERFYYKKYTNWIWKLDNTVRSRYSGIRFTGIFD